MKDIIVSTWGIGVSYRKRVIHNIEKAINTGYDKVLPYIILTDKPEEFDGLRKKYPDKIIDVVDIKVMREKYSPWSKEFEYISKEDTEEGYGNDYRESNYHKGKYFSYGLHRFVLPRICELGYNKFLFCDSDTDIRYDKIVNKEISEEDFWKEFDTPVNTMKGCDFEIMSLSHGVWNQQTVIFGNILRYVLSIKFPQFNHPNLGILKTTHTQTEGPFRFYHLKNSKMIKDYFDLWNEATHITMNSPQLKQHINPGMYMYIDNVLVTAANEMLEIKSMGFARSESVNKIHKVNIYKEDRYFFPTGITHTVEGEHLSLQPADTIEEFNKINKKLIDFLKSRNDWDE